MKKAIKRSIIILSLLAVSLLAGFGWEFIATQIDKRTHPIKYEEQVTKYAGLFAVPEEIVYAVIRTESSFRSDAVSVKGAVGLMQITPDTFEWLMTKTGESLDIGMLYNPDTNIKYGTYLLSMLHSEFGDWQLTYAAYNAGRSRVRNDWMMNPEYISENGEIIYIPFEETRNYIKKVTNSAQTYKKLYFTT